MEQHSSPGISNAPRAVHNPRRRVVIVGGGFGGMKAIRALKNAPVDVTLIDRRNHHLFQPLLYQVATAGLSPADIAAPIRAVVRHQKNAEVLLGEVVGVDPVRKRVLLKGGEGHAIPPDASPEIAYDDLILATGSKHSYFGNDQWEKIAPGLKSINDATRIRQKILLAFEQAEMETDDERRKAYLTFVIVGGGPTGVELAGSIAELSHKALKRDFRHIDPRSTRILIVDAGPRILAAFPDSLAEKAAKYLHSKGVEIRVNQRVTVVDENGVEASGVRIFSKNVIWAAGVAASPAGKWLGVETDRAGRVKVNADCSVPGLKDIYVIGDTALFVQDGKPVPGLAPAAMQQGKYVGDLLRNQAIRLAKNQDLEPPKPFHYHDKGNLATVGRSFAVADLGWLRLSGFIAWLAWIVVHVYYLIDFRNRVMVLLEWAWAYLTFQRGARIITREP